MGLGFNTDCKARGPDCWFSMQLIEPTRISAQLLDYAPPDGVTFNEFRLQTLRVAPRCPRPHGECERTAPVGCEPAADGGRGRRSGHCAPCSEHVGAGASVQIDAVAGPAILLCYEVRFSALPAAGAHRRGSLRVSAACATAGSRPPHFFVRPFAVRAIS